MCPFNAPAVRSVGSPPGVAPVEARATATESDPRLHRSLLRASGSATDRTPEANRSSRSLASGATAGLRHPGSRRRRPDGADRCFASSQAEAAGRVDVPTKRRPRLIRWRRRCCRCSSRGWATWWSVRTDARSCCSRSHSRSCWRRSASCLRARSLGCACSSCCWCSTWGCSVCVRSRSSTWDARRRRCSSPRSSSWPSCLTWRPGTSRSVATRSSTASSRTRSRTTCCRRGASSSIGRPAPEREPHLPQGRPLVASRQVLEAADPAERPWTTILLLGTDEGPGNWGARTDTIILAAFEQGTRRAVAFGIPRNLINLRVGGNLPVFPEPINALYSYARAHPDLLPPARDPGATPSSSRSHSCSPCASTTTRSRTSAASPVSSMRSAASPST